MKAKEKGTKLNWLLSVILSLLALYILSLILLLFWTLLTTLKTPLEYDFMGNRLGLPESPSFSNYATAYKFFYVKVYDETIKQYLYYNVWSQFGHSIMYSLGTAVSSTLVPCLVAYVSARYRYRFLKIYYVIVIVTMALPIVGSLPSEIVMVKSLGLFDSFVGQWICKGHFLGLYFLVFFAQFKMIPFEYAEAAKIDGASDFRIMAQIIMPLAWATISTVMLLNFVTYWNDYQIPMIYLPSYPVAAYGIFKFQSSYEQELSNTPTKLAGIILLTLPIIIIFLIFQRRLMTNLSIGGLKG